MPYSQKKSASKVANYQKRNHANPNHAAKKAKNGCRPFNDDRRLDQNNPLDDQRASLVMAERVGDPADAAFEVMISQEVADEPNPAPTPPVSGHSSAAVKVDGALETETSTAEAAKFKPGDVVVLHGLPQSLKLNGAEGTVVSYHEFLGSGFEVFEVQLDEHIDESVGSNSNHKIVKSENLRASTDSDAEEAEGFWDSDDDGADERGGEEEEEVLSFQGQLLEAASPSKRTRAPAASAGAVKPDIVDGEAVLPNLLLAYMYRPLGFMVYSPYEFSGV